MARLIAHGSHALLRALAAVAAMLVPLILGIGIFAVRTRTRYRPPLLLALIAILTSISATSTLGSPYIITPALLAAYAMTIATTAMPSRAWRVQWSAMCLAAAAIPMVLQAFELLPVGFSVEQGRAIIEHRISDASPATVMATLVIVTLATVFTPTAFAFSNARQLHETRKRLLLHVWHLRKLTRAG